MGLGLGAVILVIISISDFVHTAVARDVKVQEVTLKGELAQFLLATTQEDGSSLLENPRDFGPALRSMQPVQLQRPFFTYFLTTGNGQTISASNISWSIPRACAVDFVDNISKSPTKSLRACFGVVPGDVSGRFIYFALRYPTTGIVRHQPGNPLDRASSLVIEMHGDTKAIMRLVFEQPKYAQSRFPSQLTRFTGIHELTAYHVDRSGVLARGVQGQAYERRFDSQDGTSANFVTIAGRLDAGLVFNTAESAQGWAQGRFRAMVLSAQTFEVDPSTQKARPNIQIPLEAKGTALQSLEQAYLTNVQSRALLEVRPASKTGESAPPPWTSGELIDKAPPAGTFQRISNNWANFLLRQFEVKTPNTPASLTVPGSAQSLATLTAEPVLLPDLAARAFFGLTGALLIMFLLGIFWLNALSRLRTIASFAVQSAKKPASGPNLSLYKGKRDQVGMMGRSLGDLVLRFRSRNATIRKNAEAAERRRVERVRLQDAQVEARHDVLRAIGHEIRTPLQALMIRKDDLPELRPDIEKMNRAVEAFYFATSVETGIKERRIIPKNLDLSSFLVKLSENNSELVGPINYRGELQGQTAYFDPFALEDVLDNILRNAAEHRSASMVVEIALKCTDEVAEVRIHNKGEPISEEDLPQIFNYNFTTKQGVEGHMGLGLFSARIYVLGMRGSIKAVNEDGGVTFIVMLPRQSPAA